MIKPLPPGASASTLPSLWQPELHAGPTRRLQHGLGASQDSDESALLPARLQAGRELRVAASFCETQDEAVWLYRRLRAQPRLSEDQVQLLGPVDATPRRFLQRRHTWDSLRPLSQRAASTSAWALLQASLLLGLLLGLGLGLLTGLSIIETLVATLLGTLLTLGIGMVLRPLISKAAQHRHFDQVLQHRLARGQYAVVVTGVRDPAAAIQAIVAMRSVGLYWCAETPHKTP